jgi:threonine synthase
MDRKPPEPDTLECLFCGQRRAWDPFSYFCPECLEPMVFARDGRERSIHLEKSYPLERYLEFLPLDNVNPNLGLGEGDTPLLPLTKLGSEIGLSRLCAKCEVQNPTSSFKDRGTAVAVQKAATLGFKRIGTVSTGNMAASTAAYGARAGLETFVLLKEEASLPSLLAAGIFGPRLMRVTGDYGRLFHLSLEIGKKSGIWFMNSIDPVRVEGYKLVGFEIFQQLGDIPDFVIVPVSSGGHFIGLMRAYEDLARCGFTGRFPTFVGVQAEGCAPLAAAFAAGRDRYERLDKAETIAQAISNPAPPAGNVVLKMVRDHGARVISVGDEDILGAQRMLANREGLFVQPESATALAGLIRMIREDLIRPESRAVLVLTGSGLKAPWALESQPIRVEETDLSKLGKILK